MANYPEWVMKHKVKGTYINHVKGKYYLYAAHSIRIKGTNKVKRIFDGYLGRITEDEGLIPPKDKVEKPVFVMEYDLSSTILYLCKDIHSGFRRSFSKNGNFVMLASVLSFIYGKYNNFLYKQSYLSVVFAGIYLNIFIDINIMLNIGVLYNNKFSIFVNIYVDLKVVQILSVFPKS